MSLRFVTFAGHGGEDPGALNPYNPMLPEKHINLYLDQEFARLALLNGHQVTRLRTGDIKVSANEIAPAALSVDAHAIFEFHCDSVSNPSANGCHSIVYPNSPGAVVGNNISSNIDALTGIRSLGIRDHFYGTSPTPIYTINITRFQQLSNRIHAMTENGFISNFSDQEILATSIGRTRIAYAHLSSVHSYFSLPEPIFEQPGEPGKFFGWIGVALAGFAIVTVAAKAGAKGKMV